MGGAVTNLSLVTDVSLCGDDVRGPIKVADQCLEHAGLRHRSQIGISPRVVRLKLGPASCHH